LPSATADASRTTGKLPPQIESVLERLEAMDPDKRREALGQMDPKFVRSLLAAARERMPPEARPKVDRIVKKSADEWRPKTDEELWRFIRDEIGMEIPRKVVVAGNRAPFDVVADVVFERGLPDKLVIGNRGSGKTIGMAVAHAVCVRFKPKWQGATVGAVEPQAKRCYAHFKEIVERPSWIALVDGKPKQGGTTMRHGGKVEIIVGTMSGVNSPHPNVAHQDEIELFRPGVFQEAANMAQSTNGHRAMNVYTTSWKFIRGIVTTMREEVRDAEATGMAPPVEEYVWGIFETSKRCEHDCSDCPYSRHVRGKWDDGRPRTFEQMCKKDSQYRDSDGRVLGKLSQSDGHIAVEDSVSRFLKLSRRTWEAQQESRRPTAEGLVYGEWDEERNALSPEHGDEIESMVLAGSADLYVSIDFGGTDPHAVGLWVEPDEEVDLGDGRRIPQGASVLVREIYAPGIGNVALGRMLNSMLMSMGMLGKSKAIFGDAAQKAGRSDLRRLSTFGSDDPEMADIPVSAVPKPEIKNRIGHVQSEIAAEKLWVVSERCRNFVDEIGLYQQDPNTGRLLGDDHHMDEMGYYSWGRHLMRRRQWQPGGAPQGTDAEVPRSVRGERGAPKFDADALTRIAEPPAESGPRVSGGVVRSGRAYTGSPFG
jgi:hypothetical protein